ncbi:MAG TPA: hypothetical protein VH796_04560 [Nitrososphaeraceae archaeon]|jgi:hypothetical protein
MGSGGGIMSPNDNKDLSLQFTLKDLYAISTCHILPLPCGAGFATYNTYPGKND